MWWEAVKCAAAGYQYIIMDLPLLFEAGIMVPYMHKIIVVTCEEDVFKLLNMDYLPPTQRNVEG